MLAEVGHGTISDAFIAKALNIITYIFISTECRLEPVPNQPGYYKNMDAFGGTVMPCPVGTVFNPAKCQCEQDINNLLRKAPPIGNRNTLPDHADCFAFPKTSCTLLFLSITHGFTNNPQT